MGLAVVTAVSGEAETSFYNPAGLTDIDGTVRWLHSILRTRHEKFEK